MNCSIRLTTREHIYLYEEDNVDEDEPGIEEGADDDDMYEDVTEMDDLGEEENFQHNLAVLKGEKSDGNDEPKSNGKSNGVNSKDIERILAEREKLGLDEDENGADDEDGVDDREGDGAGEPAIVIQSSWKNERRNHMVQENEPNLLKYPLEFKTAFEKLLSLKETEWISLSDLELPASEAVQFAVSLWAEGLIEPRE